MAAPTTAPQRFRLGLCPDPTSSGGDQELSAVSAGIPHSCGSRGCGGGSVAACLPDAPAAAAGLCSRRAQKVPPPPSLPGWPPGVNAPPPPVCSSVRLHVCQSDRLSVPLAAQRGILAFLHSALRAATLAGCQSVRWSVRPSESLRPTSNAASLFRSSVPTVLSHSVPLAAPLDQISSVCPSIKTSHPCPCCSSPSRRRACAWIWHLMIFSIHLSILICPGFPNALVLESFLQVDIAILHIT
ncbi:uncharacterized protein LOC106997165 [Macaca mulatta]